ncbi:MAG: 23S rRNA (guanosine(2251)-2'-O)-methyltransferase RlmB [Granulosicoccaceae bacterium]|jgi:23S rRNA (guanosine2251-2'-O)-methyltransferase
MAASEIVYGIHAVQSLLAREPERVLEVWLDRSRQDKRIQPILALLQQHGLKAHYTDRKQLEQQAGSDRHQGVVARCKGAAARNEAALDKLLGALGQPPFLLVLDGVQDPHNLGACLRTADACGVHAVIVPKDKAAGLTATVRKVASGAVETVPLIAVTNLARTLRGLQQRGIWVTGLAGEAEAGLYEADLKGPQALVMGAEGKGLRRLTRETCDTLVKIPMLGSVGSLNVSVATGVCLYEALRQRQGN